MKGLGQTGAALPRATVADYENVLAIMATVGANKAVKAKLTELRDATAAYDKSRDTSGAAAREAIQREKAALKAGEDATLARQSLADETATATTTLGEREAAVAERERLAGECETSQEARDKELARRENHLAKAGVRGF